MQVARFAVVASMGAALLLSVAFTPTRAPNPEPPIPLLQPSEYVSSNACRSCHPSEYASWHDSYHRTMTQAARGSSVLAPLDHPVSLTLDGQSYTVAKRGDAVWATLPEQSAAAPRQVLIATGSHHYQAYWLAGERAGDLHLFPFVYLLGESPGWAPRRDVFVQPPDAPESPVRWGGNCIQCHATAGRPAREAHPESLAVAELGIACEACHGPGAAHVAEYRNPIARYAVYANDRPDATLVNPSRLSPERASMICATCHAYTYPVDEDDFWAHGYTHAYRPGQDLDAGRILLTAEGLRRGGPGSPSLDTDAENLFYDDGTVRIGGREYNGMILSACFVRGEGKHKLSCLSCHSMHDSEPDDQLTHGREGDVACASCHERARFASASHTHHGDGSPGATCLGCHMPKTAYALLKSIRSHRIDSPVRANLSGSDRPNACNLCHLDRTLAWTSLYLERWYGQGVSSVPPDTETPAGAAWLLAGDPAQRSLAAAAMGEPGALRAVGKEWEASLLASALEDPYAAVRFIAARSLHRLGGVAPRKGEGPVDPRPDSSPVDPRSIDALIAARSTRALTLSE
jgi:hypothetical protein